MADWSTLDCTPWWHGQLTLSRNCNKRTNCGAIVANASDIYDAQKGAIKCAEHIVNRLASVKAKLDPNISQVL